jgi:hypothetical protein
MSGIYTKQVQRRALQRELCMADASIRRNRVGVYQVRFRFEGRQYERSLGTKIRRDADDRLGEVRKVIRYLEDGVLNLPEGVDPVGFVISGGKLRPGPKEQVVAEPEARPPLTIQEAGERYFDSFPPGSKEAETIKTERVHFKHLTRLLGSNTVLEALGRDDLQGYVGRRIKERGLRGKVQRKTVEMELATFRQIWAWSLSLACPIHEWH